MRCTRVFASAAVVVTLSTLGTTPAWAAPPANDTERGGHRCIHRLQSGARHIPGHHGCARRTAQRVVRGAVHRRQRLVHDRRHGRWSRRRRVRFQLSGRRACRCGIAEGTRDGELRSGAAGFFAESGTTYYVLAIDDQSDGAGNGGQLRISFNVAPPPPTVDITVNASGTVNKAGVAHVSGTYTCTDAEFIEVFGDMTQPVGRFAIRGYFGFFDVETCDGEPHAWEADVFPDNGKFAGGKSVTIAFGFACGSFECGEGFTEQKVQLRGTRR